MIGQQTSILAPENAYRSSTCRTVSFTAAVWDLPFGQAGALGHVLRGWQISPIVEAQAGLAVTPTVNGNPANTTGAQRPDRLRDANLSRGERGPDRWFDPAAFRVPVPFTFGNSAANVINGPGLVSLDLTIARTFRVSEKISLDFRSEFFNLFNDAHFSFPNTVVNTPQAGLISETQARRGRSDDHLWITAVTASPSSATCPLSIHCQGSRSRKDSSCSMRH